MIMNKTMEGSPTMKMTSELQYYLQKYYDKFHRDILLSELESNLTEDNLITLIKMSLIGQEDLIHWSDIHISSCSYK